MAIAGNPQPEDSARGAAERFAGGTAVVTGGGAGIGAGFVRYLAQLGMRVVVVDIDAARAEQLATELGDAGADVIAWPLDVTDADAVDDLAQALFDRYGTVELLINNAGLETAGLTWEIPVARWRQVLTVNVDGMFFGIRAFVPRMIAAARPAVIANLSSVGGISTVPFQTPYIVSKHAVLALTECLHQELALTEAPIQVSAVLPYRVRSEIFLDAQRDAPTDNPAANQLFAAMQRASVEDALDPVVAAEHMMVGIARGDFWVFSHDEYCAGIARNRAATLTALTPPADPRAFLQARGVDVR
jgi:NAD(P)-dependent dehydrogenase (short-subunit alcohol dehydrogenase family)